MAKDPSMDRLVFQQRLNIDLRKRQIIFFSKICNSISDWDWCIKNSGEQVHGSD